MNRANLLYLLTAAVVALLFVVPPSALAASAADGFLYGKVTTSSGNSFQGFLRWGKEEAFWGDLFNSAKEKLPYAKYVPERERRRRDVIEIFGIRIGSHLGDGEPSRVFAARFGDIARIEVLGGDEARITMKSGATVAVEGGANDVDADITVHDVAAGDITVPWRKIDTIEFFAAPADAKPYATRLHGRVVSADATFDGFIQWDSEECLSTDKLDGDSDDGRLALDMGQIRAIQRRTRGSSLVELADGRKVVLTGTNDVDSDIRGVLVEDPRYGRVEVSWDAFRRVEFSTPPGSGPAYSEFTPGAPLRGVVKDTNGRDHRGRIVFDLDEAESWEILQGSADDVEYLIPFERIAAIEPAGRHASRVTLRGGATLRLEDSQDVSEVNAGVLVFKDGARDPEYVPWDEVRRIEFAQ